MNQNNVIQNLQIRESNIIEAVDRTRADHSQGMFNWHPDKF
jgi:hypothetical protein